ncbi:energy transducer TonB [Flavobacterium mesophilum]|uniref:energy transducer TonB n=1 Tax=Flavobacterium mesophilum TaxID=3143495 RepID=UPI0031D98925
MKKILLLILICSAQNIFSQSNTQNSKTKSSEPAVKTQNGTADAIITIDEPVYSSSTNTNEDNVVYNAAGIDVKPDFPGGMDKFYQFVDSNFKTPEGAKNITGKKIYITFVVEKDGSLTDIKILRDAGYNTGAEAIRVLKSCPKWNPGEHNGKKIRVLYSLPIIMK